MNTTSWDAEVELTCSSHKVTTLAEPEIQISGSRFTYII